MTIEDKATRDYLKFHILRSRINWTGVINKTDLEDFEGINPNPNYLKVIRGKFSQIPKSLREEMILPNYTFFDKNDEEKNLNDFRGKILYIDLWATWCTPCLEMQPYFNALSKDFENEKDEIEFIGISLDRELDKGKWKKLIKRRKLEGTQLIAMDAFKSEICKDLKVTMIPRFIIVGRDGELIQSQAHGSRHFEIRKILAELIRKP